MYIHICDLSDTYCVHSDTCIDVSLIQSLVATCVVMVVHHVTFLSDNLINLFSVHDNCYCAA